MKKIITNKTRCLGFGYNTIFVQGEEFPYKPSKPNFVGNIKQIQEQIHNNKEFQSIKSSGISYNWSFFYKDERIVSINPFGRWELISNSPFEMVWEFLHNLNLKVEIETERGSK